MNKKSNSIVELNRRNNFWKSFSKIRLRNIVAKKDVIKIFSFIMIFSIIVISGITVYDAIWQPPSKTILRVKVKKTVLLNQEGVPISTETSKFTETSYEHINNPVDHFKYAFNYLLASPVEVKSTPSEWQEPWTWVLPIHPFRSAGYLVVTVRTGDIVFYKINWLAQATLPIWYSFWLILPMTVWNLLKRKYTKFDILFLTWMASAYLPWIIWGIRDVQRFPFNYMFLYALPALCLGIPYFWSRLAIPANLRKIGLFTHLVVTIAFFLYFYPVGFIFK